MTYNLFSNDLEKIYLSSIIYRRESKTDWIIEQIW